MTALTERPKTSVLSHEINNRMNAIAIGMTILENHDREEVRDLAFVIQQDLDELQSLLEQYQQEIQD